MGGSIPPVHPWHFHPIFTPKIAPKGISVLPFIEIICFFPKNLTTFFVNTNPVPSFTPFGMILEIISNFLQNSQINSKQLLEARTLDLNNHFFPRMELSFMNLT